jgi:murein DD-endopeptidase MepM/ murein hydrolase activator NlpD
VHIIFVPSRAAATKKISILPWQICSFVVGFVTLSVALSFFCSWLSVYFKLPFVQNMVTSAQETRDREIEDYTRDNIKSMAVRLGEMQAQLVRLDLLGERISKTSGVPFLKNDTKVPAEIDSKSDAGAEAKDAAQGGPLVRVSSQKFLANLQRDIDRLSDAIALQSDNLTVLESQLIERRIQTSLLPTIPPINARPGSKFGVRVDPINGAIAMHEGIDFAAEVGTPIVAAAGGVVTFASFHRQYGNMVEIDHGNDFSSRYAHMSKLEVKPGQIVKRKQAIGFSGNTGRTTGPHLHFEVRFKGVAQNPARFLQMREKEADAIVSEGRVPATSPEKTPAG